MVASETGLARDGFFVTQPIRSIPQPIQQILRFVFSVFRIFAPASDPVSLGNDEFKLKVECRSDPSNNWDSNPASCQSGVSAFHAYGGIIHDRS